jgi:hypothetical protein
VRPGETVEIQENRLTVLNLDVRHVMVVAQVMSCGGVRVKVGRSELPARGAAWIVMGKPFAVHSGTTML